KNKNPALRPFLTAMFITGQAWIGLVSTTPYRINHLTLNKKTTILPISYGIQEARDLNPPCALSYSSVSNN
ncbi:MAG: hypothetical protein V3V45_02085, partial [Candidatus Brocadiales bacterium]